MASTTKKHQQTTTTPNHPKMYVYDFTGIGGRTPEYHPTTVATKKPSPKGYIWSLTRSLMPASKEQGKNIDPKKQTLSPALEKQGKKQTFSPAFEKPGRKSVSHVEDYIVKKEQEEPRRASLTTSFEEMKPKRFVVEGRKSVSHVENHVAYVGKQGRGKSSLEKEVELMQVKVLVSDMPGFMQVHAFRCARNTYDSLEKFSSRHMAFNLKKEFDKVYGPAWHCIVGSSFGSFVTHSTGCFLYFSLEKLYVLLFRTKVRQASE